MPAVVTVFDMPSNFGHPSASMHHTHDGHEALSGAVALYLKNRMFITITRRMNFLA